MNKKTIILIAVILLATVLRLYKLAENPPSLYWDEASLGYNAYTIANYGIDEHGEYFPVSRFIAFGDYKPPGYIYLDAIIQKVVGLSEFSIRIPSALSGMALVIVIYFLANKILSKKIALLASLGVAFSPWSLHLSRAAYEANVAALFNCAGVFFFLSGIQKKQYNILISALFFIAAFYTFNANRIITPLLLLFLVVINVQILLKQKKILFAAGILAVLCVIPSLSFLFSREGRLRFNEVSIFNNLETIQTSNARILRENNAIWAKIFQNRRVIFVHDFLVHFADHLNPSYLFISGDINPRLSSQTSGLLYLIEAPFLIVGLLWLLKNNGKTALLLIGWYCITILPAATARETPHALRTISSLPVVYIISSSGMYFMFKKLTSVRKYLLPVLTGLLGIYFFCWVMYLHDYYLHFPRTWYGEWQYGYKQMIQKVLSLESAYDSIVITNKYGRAYIYYLLYGQIAPSRFVENRRAQRDWWGLWQVYGYQKVFFGSEQLSNAGGKTLFIGAPEEIPAGKPILADVVGPDGKPVFQFVEL